MQFDQNILDEYVSRGFCTGLGDPKKQVCVEVAIALACGLEPTDSPACVHPMIRSHSIRLNDCERWSSPKARADGMRAYAIAQIGTTDIDSRQWGRRLAFLTITRLLPLALEACGLDAKACRAAETLGQARSASFAAAAAAASFAADAADATSAYAASAAYASAASADASAYAYAYAAADAYAAAYVSAAYASAAYASAAYASAASADKILSLAADSGCGRNHVRCFWRGPAMKTVEFDEAWNALRNWYMNEVSSWAEDFDKRIVAREWSSEEDFRDAFHRETDGAACIIYTAQAKAVLLASDNEDAYVEEFGEEPTTVEARALMAFQRDIQERMQEEPSSLDEEPDETE